MLLNWSTFSNRPSRLHRKHSLTTFCERLPFSPQDAEEKERRAVARSEALILSLQQQRDQANALHKQAEERAAELAEELQRLIKSNKSAITRVQNAPTQRPSTAPTPREGFPSIRRPPPALQISVPPQGAGTSSLGSPLPAPSPIPSLGLSYAASPRPGKPLTSPRVLLTSPRGRAPGGAEIFENLDFDGNHDAAGREFRGNDPGSGFQAAAESADFQGLGEGDVGQGANLEQENELLRHSLAGLAAQNEQIRAVVHHMRGEMEELQKRAAVAMTPRVGKAEGKRILFAGNAPGEVGTEEDQPPEGRRQLGNDLEEAGNNVTRSEVDGWPRAGGAAAEDAEEESGGGLNPPQEVEQLREELGIVQQRLAQMSARLEPVLTTVENLQHPLYTARVTGYAYPLDRALGEREGLAPMHFPGDRHGGGLVGFEGLGHPAPGGELGVALEEVQRLADERDRLMELSNALRADLKRRTTANPPVKQVANPDRADPNPQPSAQLERGFLAQRAAPPQPVRQTAPQSRGMGEAQAKQNESVRAAAGSKRTDGGMGPSAGGPFVVSGVQAPRATVVEIIHKVRALEAVRPLCTCLGDFVAFL